MHPYTNERAREEHKTTPTITMDNSQTTQEEE
jgi:hypothetical protein